MDRIKYIIIACVIALLVLGTVTYLINLNINKSYINVAVANSKINEGEKISTKNISWVKLDTSNVDVENYITENNINSMTDYVLSNSLEKGQVIWKKNLIKNEEYLETTEGLEYIALPVKSATEGVCYKFKKGDRISVYYTAKKKLVDSVLKDKKKIYSVATSETLVTCLLYDNLEIIAMTNNIGQDVSGTSITDIVVRLTGEEAMELANLKEQGTFTLTIK